MCELCNVTTALCKMNVNKLVGTNLHTSGGSRISRWGVADPLGGCQPLMCTLFSKNVCKNERNGSCWGGGMCRRCPPDPPMHTLISGRSRISLWWGADPWGGRRPLMRVLLDVQICLGDQVLKKI